MFWARSRTLGSNAGAVMGRVFQGGSPCYPFATGVSGILSRKPCTTGGEKRMGERFPEIREGVRAVCGEFDAAYYRREGYPDEFVRALTKAGWLAAPVPAEYGGSGRGLAEASVIMEEINRCGGN